MTEMEEIRVDISSVVQALSEMKSGWLATLVTLLQDEIMLSVV